MKRYQHTSIIYGYVECAGMFCLYYIVTQLKNCRLNSCVCGLGGNGSFTLNGKHSVNYVNVGPDKKQQT